MIKLSFIIATFNCENIIPILAKTAILWKDLPVEFCLIDGGSTDNTLALIKKYSTLRLLVSEKDNGIYDAWNKGIKLAGGDYLSFIGADDIPTLDFYYAVSNELANVENPPLFVYGNAILTYEKRLRFWNSPSNPRLFDSSVGLFDIPHPGSYNHKSLFVNHRFDDAYKLAGDLEFYVKYQKNREITYLKVSKIQAFIGADGVSRSAGATRRYRIEKNKISKNLEYPIMSITYKSRAIELLEKSQILFDLIKKLIWMLRGVKFD